MLKDKIIVRYEPAINNGTCFVFNPNTGAIKTTDKTGYEILKKLEKSEDYKELLSEVRDSDLNVDEETLQDFLDRLGKAGFLV